MNENNTTLSQFDFGPEFESTGHHLEDGFAPNPTYLEVDFVAWNPSGPDMDGPIPNYSAGEMNDA